MAIAHAHAVLAHVSMSLRPRICRLPDCVLLMALFVSDYTAARRRKRQACRPHPQETDWSPCSVTCGVGTQTRRTNLYLGELKQCKLTTETQLCKLRDCGMAVVRLLSRIVVLQLNNLVKNTLININLLVWLLVGWHFFKVKLTFEMLTVRGQQHSFSTHERVFLWKCQSFWDRKCLDLRGLEPPTFGFMLNALTYWAIRATQLLSNVFEHWLWRYRYDRWQIYQSKDNLTIHVK